MTINLSLRMPNYIGQRASKRLSWFSFYRHGRVGENKGWEIQADYWGWGNLFTFDLDISWSGRDHAGLHMEFVILGFGLYVDFNDNRHWDDETNTWEKYDEASVKERMSRHEEERAAEVERAYMLVNEDRKILTKQNAIDFLETPQGQAMIDQRVKVRLEEQRASKEAKAARGEAYRRANLEKQDDTK